MPARKNDGPAPFLRREALERIGGDADFLGELLVLYDDEFAAKMTQLKTALARKNFESVRALGHGLKGASANLSLPGLRDAALAAEMAGEEKNPNRVRSALDALDREYRRLKAFLN